MKYIKLMILLALSGSVWAQKEMVLPAFNKINLDESVRVKLVSGESPKAIYPNDLSGLTLSVKEGELDIDFNGEKPMDGNDFIEVYYKDLNEIEVNGAGVVEMKKGSVLVGDKFELTCNGVANVNLNFEVKDLKISGSGASKFTLAGKTALATIDLAGASKLFAQDLLCTDLKMDAAGASYFNVHCSNDMQIDASGVSKGVYNGNPVNKKINVSGVASIVDATTGENIHDERTSNDDTTRIKVGNKKFIIIDEKEENSKLGKKQKEEKRYELKSVYAGFEIGMNQLVSPNLNFNLPQGYTYLDCKTEKSWFYGLNLIERDFQLIKNKLAITSGFGMEFQNFNFNSNQILTPNVNKVMADSGLVTLSKNKLYNYNLNVPLFIKYAPRGRKDRNKFHFAVGVIGSFKAYSHIKIETSANGYEEEYKVRDDYNINPFRLTGTVRVGYGWVRAFANYSLTPYFNTQNKNPDLRVFSAGLTLFSFD